MPILINRFVKYVHKVSVVTLCFLITRFLKYVDMVNVVTLCSVSGRNVCCSRQTGLQAFLQNCKCVGLESDIFWIQAEIPWSLLLDLVSFR